MDIEKRKHLVAEIDKAIARVALDAARIERDRWRLAELRERVRKGGTIPLERTELLERWAVDVTPSALARAARGALSRPSSQQPSARATGSSREAAGPGPGALEYPCEQHAGPAEASQAQTPADAA